MNEPAGQVGDSRIAVPHLIHMVFFPWDRNQKLLADCHDFDHGPYERMVRYARGFEVRLWTLDGTQALLEEEAPGFWRLMQALARPTMMVDLLRWWLVHRFGGIYWQYDMNPLQPMNAFLPVAGKGVRLFTEAENGPAFCQAMAAEPIRAGEPEEPIRLCNQVFSSIPGHRFIRAVLDLVEERCRRLKPRRDYDIFLYLRQRCTEHGLRSLRNGGSGGGAIRPARDPKVGQAVVQGDLAHG